MKVTKSNLSFNTKSIILVTLTFLLLTQSIQSQTCPDTTTCYNGSSCIAIGYSSGTLNIRGSDGNCATSCGASECLENTKTLLCISVDATHIKDYNGKCATTCSYGYCYNSGNVCVSNSSTNIRDVDGSCKTGCTGNTCFSVANKYTCRATSRYNFKQLDSSCNGFCKFGSCISDTTNYICSAVSSSNLRGTNDVCISDTVCPAGTCLDTYHSCLFTYVGRIRKVDGTCGTTCDGDYCFSSDNQYTCTALDTNYKQLNSSCGDSCKGSSCYEGTSQICIATSSTKIKTATSQCSSSCTASECINSNNVCTAISATNLLYSTMCVTTCPDNYCYNSNNECVNSNSLTPKNNGSCYDCSTSECYDKATDTCITAVSGNYRNNDNGVCVNEITCISVNNKCKDDTNKKCYPLDNSHKSDSSDNCVVCNASQCFDTSNYTCTTISTTGPLLNTDGTCVSKCEYGYCFENSGSGVCIEITNYRNGSTTECSATCGDSPTTCIDIDDSKICRDVTTDFTGESDSKCTYSISNYCSLGECLNIKNTCIAATAENVRRLNTFKCALVCADGECYNPSTYNCIQTNAANLRTKNGSCGVTCGADYTVNVQNYTCYFDNQSIVDNNILDCPAGQCFSIASKLCEAVSATNLRQPDDTCGASCPGFTCYNNGNTNFICEDVPSNYIAQLDGTCLAVPSSPNTGCDVETASCKYGPNSNGAYKCVNTTTTLIRHPDTGVCIKECPENYCYDSDKVCIGISGTNLRQLDGSCESSCVNTSSCKPSDTTDYVCTDVSYGVLYRDSAGNCVSDCPSTYCLNTSNNNCELAEDGKLRDFDGTCKGFCTGSYCTPVSSFECVAIPSGKVKSFSSACSDEPCSTGCYDFNSKICYDTAAPGVNYTNTSDVCTCSNTNNCFVDGICIIPEKNYYNMNGVCKSSCDSGYCFDKSYNCVSSTDIDSSGFCTKSSTRTVYSYSYESSEPHKRHILKIASSMETNLRHFVDTNSYFNIYKTGSSPETIFYSTLIPKPNYSIYNYYISHIDLRNKYKYLVITYDSTSCLDSKTREFVFSVYPASCSTDAVEIYNASASANKMIYFRTETDVVYSNNIISSGLTFDSVDYTIDDLLLKPIYDSNCS